MSTWLTDDGPVYHVPSVQLSRAKSITRFDDRHTEAVAETVEETPVVSYEREREESEPGDLECRVHGLSEL